MLLAAAAHATWNISAKRAAGSRHFVWLYSVGSALLYLPIILWIFIQHRPHFDTRQYVALAATSVLHLGYSLSLQAGYRLGPVARLSHRAGLWSVAVIYRGRHSAG